MRQSADQQTRSNRRDFRKIRAWQLADELVLKVYAASSQFPREELYGLTSQIRRAAVSVAANIVEGANRQSRKEYLQFLYISRGSLEELGYYIDLAHRLDFLTATQSDELKQRREETMKVLQGLIYAVGNELRGDVSVNIAV